MPDETITVTLPASDWSTIQAGLLELPGKFGIPVINRLNQAIAEAQTPKASEPAEPPVPHIVRGKSNG